MQPRPNRREFILTVGSALAGSALAGCRAPGPRPPAAAPNDFAVIDTHTHFYDPTRPQGVPWPPADDAVLYRRVLPPDYRALPQPLPVRGTVVVEASPWVEDNQWILDLAKREPFIVGLVGNLPVGTPAFAAHLDRFAAHPLFRGIRLRGLNLAEAVERAEVRADLRRVADRGLAVDLVGNPDLLSAAKRLAGLLPGLRLVIDHLAGIRIDGGRPPADWLKRMSDLARYSEVTCKLSGLVEGTGRRGGQAPTHLEYYRPVLDAMWERFGPDRLLYGSNWPVCEHFGTLETVQRLIHEYAQSKGRSAGALLFQHNARRIYGCT